MSATSGVRPAGAEPAASDSGGVAVTTTLRAKAGHERALEEELRRLAAVVRREEPGCLLYQPARSPHDPLRYLLIERYRDPTALATHANSAHLREALPALMECLESPPEVALFAELDEASAGPGAADQTRQDAERRSRTA